MKTMNTPIDGDHYTVIQEFTGKVTVLRFQQPWRDCTGDKLVLAMTQEIETLRASLSRHLVKGGSSENQSKECQLLKRIKDEFLLDPRDPEFEEVSEELGKLFADEKD